MVLELTDADFKEKTKSGRFIVDFWASWCGPCKMLGPIFEEVSGDFEGKITFAKLNVENNDLTPGEFGVSGIPCMIILNDGEEVDRIVGAVPAEELKNKINKVLEGM